MKRSILFLMVLLSSTVISFAQTSYETKTQIVDGYIVGKQGNEIALTRIVLKVSFEQVKGTVVGAIKNVRVIASSQNGIDFHNSTSSTYCSISEEWSRYMEKRERQLFAKYYKSSSWASPNNSSIENFYLINTSEIRGFHD